MLGISCYREEKWKRFEYEYEFKYMYIVRCVYVLLVCIYIYMLGISCYKDIAFHHTSGTLRFGI